MPVIPESNERSALARMVMQAFMHWKLPTADQLSMLGLSTGSRSSLSRYRRGMPLGNTRDLLDRAGNILAIHKCLRLLFPENREEAYSWMTCRNQAFKGLSPVELVRKHGFSGLLMVRSYLDHQLGI